MSNQIEGSVHHVGQTEERGSNGFKVRVLVVKTDGDYPQTIPVEFTQDRVSKLDGLKPGQRVTVSTDLRGREWQNSNGETKYFLSLNGWRIEVQDEVPEPGRPSPVADDKPDDLPF